MALVAPGSGVLQALNVTGRRSSQQIENQPQALARKTDLNLHSADSALSSMADTTPGLNPLSVMEAAVRLHPTPGTLYVITSGVSTEDPTNLRALGWDLDANRAAALLVKQDNRVDLTGWQVHFVGLGDVAGKQPVLSLALRSRLIHYWTAICQADGAADCTPDTELLKPVSPASSNVVPVVDLPKPTVTSNGVRLPDALTFAIGSDVVQAAADASLSAVVERARRTGEVVAVVGRTDALTGTSEGNRRLSGRRAQAVAASLRGMGLPASQLDSVSGVGSRDASVASERGNPGQVGLDRNVTIIFTPIP